MLSLGSKHQFREGENIGSTWELGLFILLALVVALWDLNRSQPAKPVALKGEAELYQWPSIMFGPDI